MERLKGVLMNPGFDYFGLWLWNAEISKAVHCAGKEGRFHRNHTPNIKNNPLHSIFGRYALIFCGTCYRRSEKYLRLVITSSFPTTVRSLSRFRPSDPQNQHWQRYIFFSQFFRFGYKTLLLIDFFFLFSRFRFDSFLLWVFGFSIKIFVFSILDICIFNRYDRISIYITYKLNCNWLILSP